jgi:hypothetical protein
MIGWVWVEGVTDRGAVDWAQYFDDGDDEIEANASWHADSITLADGNTTTLDLTALTRTVLGDTLTTSLMSVKGILIVNETEDLNANLIVGGAASNAFAYPFGYDTDTVIVPPDSPMLLCNRRWGWFVDGTHKNLKLEASGGDVTYSMVIIGTTSLGTGSAE